MTGEGEVYKFERLTLAEAQQDYPALWHTAKKALPELSDEQLTTVVSLVRDTCSYCYEDNRRCYCPPCYDR